MTDLAFADQLTVAIAVLLAIGIAYAIGYAAGVAAGAELSGLVKAGIERIASVPQSDRALPAFSAGGDLSISQAAARALPLLAEHAQGRAPAANDARYRRPCAVCARLRALFLTSKKTGKN